MGASQEQADLIAPLMQYCTKLDGEKIVFYIPRSVLSGPIDMPRLLAVFAPVEIKNDLIDVPSGFGYMNTEFGPGRTWTLWFKGKARRRRSVF